MISYATINVEKSFDAIYNCDNSNFAEIEETEEKIDLLNKDISQYVSKILVHNQGVSDVAEMEDYFVITGNVERIGDHAFNVAEYVNKMIERKVKFSQKTKEEILEMKNVVIKALLSVVNYEGNVDSYIKTIEDFEDKIDEMTLNFKEAHLARMRRGECSEEGCILYSELLTDFERIGDHILNIGQVYADIYKK